MDSEMVTKFTTREILSRQRTKLLPEHGSAPTQAPRDLGSLPLEMLRNNCGQLIYLWGQPYLYREPGVETTRHPSDLYPINLWL